MSINNVLAVIPASDFDASVEWYEKVLGATGRAPMEGEEVMEWQLTDSSGVQLIGDAANAGSAYLTLGVDDVDNHVASLASHGFETTEPSTQEGIRIAVVVDPDGNRITFGQRVGS